MERQEREKNEFVIKSLVKKMLREDIINEELSAKVKKTLDKKAEERGFTKGSVYAEFKKGLAAWACVKKSNAKKNRLVIYPIKLFSS